MKLRYKIPHRVTVRMVGAKFVASCSCKNWVMATNPRNTDGIGAFLQRLLPVPTEELIQKAHEHATDHVLEAHRLTRKTAA